MEIIAQRVFRIGVQTLYRDNEDYYIEIRNRTYYSKYKVSTDKIEKWKKVLKK